MKKLKFKKIDAFATQRSGGNPAGYISLDSQNDISEDEMLQIAKELKGFVNEVGFISPASGNEFDLKFYSAEREVDFCGHATIAIMYDLIKNNKDLQKTDLIHITTNRGKLAVENRIATEDSVFIMSPEPFESDISCGIPEIADRLKMKQNEISSAYPVSVINAGLSTMIVPVKSLNAILAIAPEIHELKNFCFNQEVDIVEVFTTEVAHKSNHYRTRVFAPTFGYMEDPATGSGNSAFGYYLIKNKMWIDTTIAIEQNGSRDGFNIVKLRKKRMENDKERVFFGGGAITRIDGEYLLQ